MALTATQEAEVRRYLGYSDLSQGLYSRLEGAMSVLTAEAQAQVIAYLTNLAAIETHLRDSWGVQLAKKAEEVELWGYDGIRSLWQEGNRIVNALGAIFGVPPQRPFFGSSSDGRSGGLAGRG